MSLRIASLTSGFSVQQLPIFAFRLSSALSSLTAVFGMLQVYPARYRHCTILQMDLSKTNISLPTLLQAYSYSTSLTLLSLSNLRLSFRPISTGQLHPSRNFHLQPISLSSLRGLIYRRSYLGLGFALRCFQRLSDPCLAARLCSWRNNRCTIGRSIPVLSY